MPAAMSKEEKDAVEREKTRALWNKIQFSAFLSVCQHVITLQSEPQLMDKICGGDLVESSRVLGMATGTSALLSVILNQVGGKLIDVVGRKPGLLVGPSGNLVLGLIVYANSNSKFVVTLGRIARMIITTFSNTVVISSVMADMFTSPQEGALARTTLGAVVGLAIVGTPFVEGTILAKTQNPRLTFLLLSVLAAAQLAFTTVSIPETLSAAKKKTMDTFLQLATLNPFDFTKIYSRGSPALQKAVTVSSLLCVLEGKNLSDFAMVFMKQNMGWGVTEIRNWVSVYGLLCLSSGMSLTPHLLKTRGVRDYTVLTNSTNMFTYFIRIFVEKRNLFFVMTAIPMLPGVNGSAAHALNPITYQRATQEGFGYGEFSAWTNNVRAIVAGITPVVLGNYYLWAQRKGFGGSTYGVAGIMGAVIPGLMMMRMSDHEFRAATQEELAANRGQRAVAPAAVSGARKAE